MPSETAPKLGRRSGHSNGPESYWTDVESQTVAPSDFTTDGPSLQPATFPDLAEECEILDNVNLQPLIDAVSKPYARVGRRPHDRRAIVRAHFLTYLYKTTIGTITALHWTLMNNATFRNACGFKFPIAMKFTAGNANYSPNMTPLVKDAARRLGDFPQKVLADRGYDSERNNEWVDERGGAPIIHKRKPKSGLHQGEYNTDGIPVCECGEPREFLFTNPANGVHHYGRAPDCRSEDEDSLCYMTFWVNPQENVRLFRWRRSPRQR